MASITLHALRKDYEGHRALHDISLDIEDGEFIALVGPSGCGKSTLLRMVAGLEEISGGQLLLGDRLINNVSPKDRNVAMVFQNYALYPHMSVAENLGFALKLQGESSVEIQRRVREVAGILGLDTLLGRRPSQLSGGQRQRVAMGRAIVRKPQAFLFDEPLSNLDAKLRVQMRTEIKALHQRLRTTTLYVTHDQIEAMTMADRIVVLRNGRIEQVGRPLELYNNPANAFVAQFMGSPPMNLIDAYVSMQGNRRTLVTDDGLPLPLAAPPSLEPGRPLQLGIRPEHLEIVAPQSGGDTLSTRILVVEPTGSDTQIVTEFGRRRLSCISREQFSDSPGAALHLHFAPHHAYLFDAHSGQRITT